MAQERPVDLLAVQAMVEECMRQAPAGAPSIGYFPSRSMNQRVAWVLELLERRENVKRGQSISGVG